MANLNGDGLVECGEGCRSGNSLSMVKESEDAVESQNGCKRSNRNPVDEKSDNNLEVKKKKKVHDHGDDRSFFDCNICLDMAREPVVTCCGHLFCWACFYKLRYVDSAAKAKECPVCRGEVKDSAVVPIYGNGDSTGQPELEAGSSLMMPPRPKARRVERVRRRRVSQIPDAQSEQEEDVDEEEEIMVLMSLFHMSTHYSNLS